MSCKRIPPGLVLLVCGMLPGCSEESAPVQALTPTVPRPTLTVQDPLTDQEVQTFLSVLQSLPDQRVPVIEPLAQVTASEKLSAGQLVDVYRQEFRAMFDAAGHGERWRSNAALMDAFERHNVAPEEFAALMIRMSCAITASELSPQVQLSDAARTADRQVAGLVARIDQLNRSQQTPEAIQHRRQELESLQHLVAFSEFTQLLMDVPEASCQVVNRHRGDLAGHLPESGGLEQFEKTIEAGVVPTSFEQEVPAD